MLRGDNVGKTDEDFVSQLKTDRKIDTSFIIANKSIKVSKIGKKFVTLQFADKSGKINGIKFFNNDSEADEVYDNIIVNEPHQIRGRVEEFPSGTGQYNIKFENIKRLNRSDCDLADYIIVSDKNQEEMMQEIISTIERIENHHLKLILESFFEDENFVKEFYDCPAAKLYHHNYVGGLLEHTVSVLRICKTISDFYPALDPNLLYAGAILHDIGKIHTYDYDRISIEMSDRGIFFDHIVMCNSMIASKLDSISAIIGSNGNDNELEEFKEISMNLQHLILSHHGEKKNGWGSPVDPQTPEAVALHHADNMDAKVKHLL